MSDVIPFSPPTAGNAGTARAPWPPLALLLFRFSLVYLAISGCYWIFEFADKSTAFLGRPFNACWKPLALWTATHLFHWRGAIEPVFVRDTRYLYALLTCFLVFSAFAAIVWSFLDRRRTQYVALHHWLRVFLRYVLAYLMLHYGMDKVFLIQFPTPGLARLTERFGDFSPSSLMWAFIGSSAIYTVFGGLAEILGGALLLFRRTTTLGALITFAVMCNVTVMDFSYDVGVKLFCLNILLMAAYLVVPDLGRLVQFFLLNQATQPAPLDPVPLAKPKRKVALLLKACVILFLLVPLTMREWKSYRQIGPGATHPPLYGLYDVDEFMRNGVAHPPLLTDTARWRSVILETPNILTIRHMDDSQMTYRIHYDAAQKAISFDSPGNSQAGSELTVTQEDTGGMHLQGTFDGAPVEAKLRRVDRSSFTLVNRGFHWISESSFVR